MIKVIRQGVYFMNGKLEKETQAFMTSDKKEKAIRNTLSYAVIEAHGGTEKGVTFDWLLSDVGAPDYDCGVIGGVHALGLDSFTVPYTFVAGGADVINARAALEAAKKFGGNYLPAGVAGVSFYLAEKGAKKGEMILTNYGATAGAVGAMCVAGSDYDYLAQFLRLPFALSAPQIVCVFVKGKLRRGVGAVDTGLSFLKALEDIDASNMIFEFFGPGVANLSMESRISIDAIVRETGCLSTIWETDSSPVQPAFYDSGVSIDLTRVSPMISVCDEIEPLDEFLKKETLPCDDDLLIRDGDGEFRLNGGLIDGSIGGTYENIVEFAELLRGTRVEGDYRVYPVSRSVYKELAENGYLGLLSDEGVTVGEPANEDYFYDGAAACAVAGRYAPFRLDPRTLAASASRCGKLISALEYKELKRLKKYSPHPEYCSCYEGFGKPLKELKTDCGYAFPVQEPLPENLLVKFSCILSPNGCSSDWTYGEADGEGRYFEADDYTKKMIGSFTLAENTRCSYAVASVSCADVCDEICEERMISACLVKEAYSEEELSSLVNEGAVPFTTDKISVRADEYLYIEGLAEALRGKQERVVAKLLSKRRTRDIVLNFAPLKEEQRKMLLAGGFIGFYRKKMK